MKGKKGLKIGFALVLAGSLLAGCGNTNSAGNDVEQGNGNGGKKEKVKLSILLGAVETVDWYNETIKKFNEEHPDIEVAAEFQKEATNTLKIKLASGDAPDLVSSVAIPQELLDQGYFMDFANETYWDRMDSSVKEIAQDKNGKNYTLPLVKMYAGLFYNKQVVQELGLKDAATWEEFKSNLMAVKAQKPEMVPFYQGGKDSWTFGQQFIFLALGDYQQKLGPAATKKAQLNNDKNILKFAEPGSPVETYAQAMLDLQKEGLVNKDAVTANYDNQLEAMANGKAAYLTQGMWALNDILKKNPDSEQFIGFTFFPALMPDGKPSLISGLDGNISVSAESEHQEEIKVFLDYLTSPEIAKSFSVLRSAPSVFTDAATEWSVLAQDAEKAASEAVIIDWGSQPTGYNWDEFGKTIQELYVGAYKTPADFAQTFQEKWDKGFGK